MRRIFGLALLALPLVVGATALWGLEHASSALAAGLLVLLCGLWTHAGVKAGSAAGSRRRFRRLWWGVAWRFLLLASALYAILQAPWLKLGSFIAGLSLYVPAILIEAAIEMRPPEE